MCNLYSQRKSVEEVRAIFSAVGMPLVFPEGIPNLGPTDIHITDPAPIVRASANDEGVYELIVRRWSWPGASGKPVFNFRSEGREFSSGRCLILADGFYEYTRASDARKKRKDCWFFADPNGSMLGIAGLTRSACDIGEAFTMLTTAPGPDVAPYHNRQIAILPPAVWKRWLEGASAADLLKPRPEKSLSVQRA